MRTAPMTLSVTFGLTASRVERRAAAAQPVPAEPGQPGCRPQPRRRPLLQRAAASPHQSRRYCSTTSTPQVLLHHIGPGICLCSIHEQHCTLIRVFFTWVYLLADLQRVGGVTEWSWLSNFSCATRTAHALCTRQQLPASFLLEETGGGSQTAVVSRLRNPYKLLVLVPSSTLTSAPICIFVCTIK